MRKRFEQQLDIDGISISDVEINLRSRHELPQLLSGLQYIFETKELNEKVFALLEEKILKGKKKTGTPGMSLWEILVLGTVRLNLNTDYDDLQDLADNHFTLRGIMGVEKSILNWGEKKRYPLQTIKDNVALLDEQTLKKISQLVVQAGHDLKKNESELNEDELLEINLKTDSFAVESNIHFPTDLSLLWDSGRKCLETIALLKKYMRVQHWGKLKGWVSNLKNAYRRVSEIHRKKGKNYHPRLESATKDYLALIKQISERVVVTLVESSSVSDVIALNLLITLKMYHDYLLKLQDQVERRILKGEKIPHEEKIFSIFEPHVEWLQKGKAGKVVELGHNVLITTDQYHFIIDHEVMIKKVDKELTIELCDRLVVILKTGYKLGSISLDRGFYSVLAKKHLSKTFELVVMPKPGNKTASQELEEAEEAFKYRRRKHSAVEANINELEHNGADKVRDKGLIGFKKYVAWSVLSYNLKQLGKILLATRKLSITTTLSEAA